MPRAKKLTAYQKRRDRAEERRIREINYRMNATISDHRRAVAGYARTQREIGHFPQRSFSKFGDLEGYLPLDLWDSTPDPSPISTSERKTQYLRVAGDVRTGRPRGRPGR